MVETSISTGTYGTVTHSEPTAIPSEAIAYIACAASTYRCSVKNRSLAMTHLDDISGALPAAVSNLWL